VSTLFMIFMVILSQFLIIQSISWEKGHFNWDLPHHILDWWLFKTSWYYQYTTRCWV